MIRGKCLCGCPAYEHRPIDDAKPVIDPCRRCGVCGYWEGWLPGSLNDHLKWGNR